jgi:hypothetical protein
MLVDLRYGFVHPLQEKVFTSALVAHHAPAYVDPRNRTAIDGASLSLADIGCVIFGVVVKHEDALA